MTWKYTGPVARNAGNFSAPYRSEIRLWIAPSLEEATHHAQVFLGNLTHTLGIPRAQTGFDLLGFNVWNVPQAKLYEEIC